MNGLTLPIRRCRARRIDQIGPAIGPSPIGCDNEGGTAELKELHRKELVVTKPKNSGSAWTPGDVARLRDLAKGNTPTRVIGIKLARTPGAVSDKASQQAISLKPMNQKPYNRRKQ